MIDDPSTRNRPATGLPWRPVLVGMAITVGLAAAIAAVARMVPRTERYYTDADQIRESADTARRRDILWQPPQPLAELLQTPADVYEPTLSADGLTLFFVRGRAGENADIYTARRTHAGWTDLQPLTDVNSAYDDLGPQPAADEQALYFYSDRPGGLGGYDLWVAYRTPNGWQSPVNLGANVNSDFNEYGPALSPEGDRLYFASNRPGADDEPGPDPRAWPATVREERYFRDYDLYIAAVTDAGITPAAPLDAINTPYNEGAPAVSPFDDFLYFGSDRPGGEGGFDLYRSRFAYEQHRAAENLGPTINTHANELDPGLSLGGYRMYFSSDRPSPPADTSPDAPLRADSVETEARVADGLHTDTPRVYKLYHTTSREVFAESEYIERMPINWAAIWSALWPNLLWALLALLLLLALLWLLRDARGRRLSLLAKCILASLMAHLLLMLLFNVWEVTASLAREFRRGGRIQVALTSPSVGTELARQVRGTLTEIDAPQPVEPPATRARIETPVEPAVTQAQLTVERLQPDAPNDPILHAAVTDATPDTVAQPPPDAPKSVPHRDQDRITQLDTALPATARAAPQPEPPTEPPTQPSQAITRPRPELDSLPDQQPAVAHLPPNQASRSAHSAPAERSSFAPAQSAADARPQPTRLADATDRLPAPARPTPPALELAGPSAHQSVAAAETPLAAPAVVVPTHRPSITSPDTLADARTHLHDVSPTPSTSAHADQPLTSAHSVSPADAVVETGATNTAPMPDATPTIPPIEAPTLTRFESAEPAHSTEPLSPTRSASAATPDPVRAAPDTDLSIDAAPTMVSDLAPTETSLARFDSPLTQMPAPSEARLHSQQQTAHVDPQGEPQASARADSPKPTDLPLPDSLALPDLEHAATTAAAESTPDDVPPLLDQRRLRPSTAAMSVRTTPFAADLDAPPLSDRIALAMADRRTVLELRDAHVPSLPDVEPQPSALAASSPEPFSLDLSLPTQQHLPPDPYAQRRAPDRLDMVERLGGTLETEQAVARALRWLAEHQSDDGNWDGDAFDSGCGHCGGETDVYVDNALTGLALLCFYGAGHTHVTDGPYRDTVERGLRWLLAQQRPDGDFRGKETMYTQGIATIAISEAYGMSGDPQLLEPIRRAVAFITRARNEDTGGWRYDPGQPGDTSVLGWQVMALKSASLSGVPVPASAVRSAKKWMDRVSSTSHPGLYAYQPNQPSSPSMTAEGMFVQQLLGVPRNDPRMAASAEYIMQHLPDWERDPATYFWYYATLALFQHQGDHWTQWNAALTRELLASQRTDGRAAGSWDPLDEWARVGGRVYQTALCTLMLEVYYRYLPLYAIEEGLDSIGTIRGIVTDAATGRPLNNATITLDIPQRDPITVTTDATGAYMLMPPEMPEFFALSASKEEYIPHTHNVASAMVHGTTLNLDFNLLPVDATIVAVEDVPEVHHLGDDRFDGRINSQFQRESEGSEFAAEFTLTSAQVPPHVGHAEVRLLAKGVQRDHRIRINGVLLDDRLDDAPSDGSFGEFTAPFDPAILHPGSNTIEIIAKPSRTDIDDFEFINIRIHLTP